MSDSSSSSSAAAAAASNPNTSAAATPLTTPTTSPPLVSAASAFLLLSAFARQYVKRETIQNMCGPNSNFVKKFYLDRQDKHQNAQTSYAKFINKKDAKGQHAFPVSYKIEFAEQFRFPFDPDSNIWDDFKRQLRELEATTKSTVLSLLKETKERGLAKLGREANKAGAIPDMIAQFAAIVKVDSSPKGILEELLIDELQGTSDRSSIASTPAAAATLSQQVQPALKKLCDELMHYFTCYVTETIDTLHMKWLETKQQQKQIREHKDALNYAAQARITGDSSAATIKQVSEKTMAKMIAPLAHEINQLKQMLTATRNRDKKRALAADSMASTPRSSSNTNASATAQAWDVDNFDELHSLTLARSQLGPRPRPFEVHQQKKLRTGPGPLTLVPSSMSMTQPTPESTKKKNKKKQATPNSAPRSVIDLTRQADFRGIPFSSSMPPGGASLQDEELNQMMDTFERTSTSSTSASAAAAAAASSSSAAPAPASPLNESGGDRTEIAKDDKAVDQPPAQQ